MTLNGKTVHIDRKNLVSLSVNRILGDGADEFTLELFDESAWMIEAALKGSSSSDSNTLTPITVSYSASTDLKTKTVLFSGTVLDYQVAFTGRSTMLTLTGILAHCGDDTVNYIFTKANIEWVGGEDLNKGIIDGKEMNWIKNNLDNEDICAIIVDKKIRNETTGEIETQKVVYYNPGRIFKRIIHKYNGDLVGTTKMETLNYTFVGERTEDSNRDYVWDFFRSNGFSEEATAGIMGNIQVESDFVTSKKQYGGPAVGIFQWEGDRQTALKEYAESQGKDWTDIEIQCDYALAEIDGGGIYNDVFERYSGSSYPRQGQYGYDYGWAEKIDLDYFKNLRDVEEATIIFEQCFERAGIPNMDNRIQWSESYYESYSGTSYSGMQYSSTITEYNWRYWRYW